MEKEKGLYQKYKVEKLNGKELGECIVLEFNDPNGREGIKAFAAAVGRAGFVQLERDLNTKLEQYGYGVLPL